MSGALYEDFNPDDFERVFSVWSQVGSFGSIDLLFYVTNEPNIVAEFFQDFTLRREWFALNARVAHREDEGMRQVRLAYQEEQTQRKAEWEARNAANLRRHEAVIASLE